MKAYFPGRTPQQLKRKGLRENRENASRMTAAILNRRPLGQRCAHRLGFMLISPVDKAYLAKSAGYDDSRAWDREEALFAEARADVEKLRGLGTTMFELDVEAVRLTSNRT